MPKINLAALKKSLKKSDLIRENYRRLRKIVLHIRYGRFWRAIKLANHYNPLYWLIVKNPVYLRYRYKKNLSHVLAKFYPSLNHVLGKKTKVALILREGSTFPRSSAFIRLISPLSSTKLEGKIDIQIIDGSKINLSDNFDFVIIQRTALDDVKAARKLIKQTQRMGGRIIVDNDDAFNHISPEHPEHKKQIKRMKAFEHLMENAEQIWLSEKTLIENRFEHKSTVIKNSLDKNIWSLRRKTKRRKPAKRLQMVYMGTATHNEDLQMILPALEKVNNKYPGKFQLKIIGVSENLPDEKWIKRLYTPRFGSLYPTFVQWFLRQGPFDIGLSPLVDNKFNRAKSDIKCLDYIAAGIMPVVSDVKPYQNEDLGNFIIKVDNQVGSWANELEKIVSDIEGFRKKKNKIMPLAQKYLWDKRSSEVTAKLLIRQLQS